MSGSSYSTSLRFEKQFTGENINLWGDKLDATIDRLDDSIAGYVAISVDSLGSYSHPVGQHQHDGRRSAPGAPEVHRHAGRQHLRHLASVSKSYRIWNATNKTLTFTLGSGNTAAVETGDKLDIWSDGTNVNHATAFGTYSLKDYIAAQTASARRLPGIVGNAGKYLYTDGASALWRQVSTADLSDYNTLIKGVQVALAVAL
jgi:hypothetical protein